MGSSMNNSWGRTFDGRALRRGSALVIVIGTLALISVFAAIYISIGRADTRSAETQQIRATQQDYTDTYAAYIADIIARDRLDATLQYADANLRYQVPRREGTDAPYTDWSVKSGSDYEFEWFFPAGGNPYPRRNAERFDPRVASDPWLASSRPQFLGAPGARPFSGTDVNRRFLDDRDWYQISNLAPDGRFVNLFNLRPQEAFDDGTIGGFNAEPGWGTANVDGLRIRRMSEGLSLLEPRDNGNPESPIQSVDPLADQRIWVPGQRERVTLGMSADEIRNTPAVWSMYQRFALIPLNQTFVTYDRNNDVSTWADPDYPAYQWADADGDGFADSRWFELTEARLDWGTNSSPRDDVQTLYEGGDMRVFAAARVIDLSGMVNVNTARDSLTPPTADFPLGLTPADIDLRRLLTMQDAAENYDGDNNPNGRDEPLAFGFLRRPSNDRGTGRQPPLLPESDYVRYQHELIDGQLNLDPGGLSATGFPTGSNPNQNPFPNAMLIGRYAADAIQKSIELNVALPASYRGELSIPGLPATDPFYLSEGSSFEVEGSGEQLLFDDINERRAEFYRRVGAINPLRLDKAGVMSLASTTYPDNADASDYGMGLFGLDDLAELLTFHGLNDPEVDSRLEIAAMGRFQFQGGTGDERFSPLHSTRPLTLDRDLHGELLVRRLNPNRGTEVTGEIAPESMALLTLSPRSRLTTVSGAVPMRPGVVAGGAGRRGTELTPVSLRVDRDAAVSIADMASDASAAFNVYYMALAGELEVFRNKQGGGADGLPTAILNRVWEPDLSITRESPYATLFYGHRGPELALRIAAHAAVNAKDMFDDDQLSTVATLILDNGSAVRNDIGRVFDAPGHDSNDFMFATNQEVNLYPGLAYSETSFDLDADPESPGDAVETRRRVLPTSQITDQRRAMVNVFGIEPTPVITEVASIKVYTDASSAILGADEDSGPTPRVRNGQAIIPADDTLTEVTINGDVVQGNPDLLMQVLAIQLTNPWDEEIRIGSDVGNTVMARQARGGSGASDRFDPDNNFEFNYYIEFNGRFFKLGEFVEYNPPGNDIDFSSSGGPILAEDQPIVAGPTLQDIQYRSVVMQPGESRVFFVTAHTRFDNDSAIALGPGLDQKWLEAMNAYGRLPVNGDRDIDNDGQLERTDGNEWTGFAQEWLARQFNIARVSGQGRAVRIHPFDPRTGELVEGVGTAVNPKDFLENLTLQPTVPTDSPSPAVDFGFTGRAADSGVVRLWKKHTVPDLEEQPASVRNGPRRGAGMIKENLIQNDILVDRLEVDQDYLHVPLASGNQPITDSVGFDEGFDVVDDECVTSDPIIINVRNDNSGITLARWASVRRRDTAEMLSDVEADPEGRIGRIDAYLLASRRNPELTLIRNSNAANRSSTLGVAEGQKLSASLDITDLFDLCDPGDPKQWDNSLSTADGQRGVAPAVAYDVSRSFVQFFDARGEYGRFRPQVRTIAMHPSWKNANPPTGGGTAVNRNPELDRFAPVRLAENTNSLLNLFADSDAIEPEVFVGQTVSSARVTDALMAMGIGPAYAPDPMRDPLTNFAVVDSEWMTLAEAFAIALGYEDYSMANPTTEVTPDIVWHDAVREYIDPDGGPDLPEYVLDDLRLRIDDYVPYLNIAQADETGAMEKPRFTFNFGANPAGSDARRGTGVPLALGVLDGVRAIDPPTYAGDFTEAKATSGDAGDGRSTISAEEQAQLDRVTLSSPIMGLVNINTAPVSVMRLLPGLTPSAVGVRTMNGTGTIRPEWWAAANDPGTAVVGEGIAFSTNLGAASLFWDSDPFIGTANSPDVAAGLVGYRDRSLVTPRYRSDRNAFTAASVGPFSYATNITNPDNQAAFLENRYAEFTMASDFWSRDSLNLIDGARGAPGFGSLGEMLMASISPQVTDSTVVAHRQVSMTQYGFDTDGTNPINLGVSGQDENAVSMSPHFVGHQSGIDDDAFRAGNVANDYAEQLALAAGVMNTTSARSDFFAVYLVLQGFREGDVATLRPADPLVPSFKKRYLMVIDRSNVIEQGDAPRIVLFREVPL